MLLQPTPCAVWCEQSLRGRDAPFVFQWEAVRAEWSNSDGIPDARGRRCGRGDSKAHSTPSSRGGSVYTPTAPTAGWGIGMCLGPFLSWQLPAGLSCHVPIATGCPGSGPGRLTRRSVSQRVRLKVMSSLFAVTPRPVASPSSVMF